MTDTSTALAGRGVSSRPWALWIGAAVMPLIGLSDRIDLELQAVVLRTMEPAHVRLWLPDRVAAR